jgi:CheY-like chemotaxis protein
VVDDDAMVLVAIRRLLGDHHELVTTTSALEAVRRIKAGEVFDVLVADLMMPCMSGIELYDEVRRLAPEIAERTIFITGGAFTASAQRFLDSVPNVRLEKPFDARELRELVSSIAERPAARAGAAA